MTTKLPPNLLDQPATGVAAASLSTAATALATGIPSWVRRVYVAISGMGTSGTSPVLLQLSTSSTFKTSGYAGSVARLAASAVASAAYGGSGFDLTAVSVAASVYGGVLVLTRLGESNTWTLEGKLYWTNTQLLSVSAGEVTLAGALDGVRLVTSNGSDTFDAGSASVTYA